MREGKKSRLGIYSIYDGQGVLDNSTLDTIESLKKVLSFLVIVINGRLQENYIRVLKRTGDRILIRENTGMDAGAYRAVLCSGTIKEHTDLFDEIVLCNDTFFGPFVPFEQIFAEMELRKCDFWALCAANGQLLDFVHSFFYCFRKASHPAMLRFFSGAVSEHTTDLSDVYATLERGLLYALRNAGLRFDTYAKKNNAILLHSNNYLLQHDNLPILKKKCFAPENYDADNALGALQYISHNMSYDIDEIIQCVSRKYHIVLCRKQIIEGTYKPAKYYPRDGGMTLTPEQLIHYILSNKQIYVYGAGLWGKAILMAYANELQGRMRGFICTDPFENRRDAFGHEIFALPEKEKELLEKKSGLIVALGKNNTETVRPMLEQKGIRALYLYGYNAAFA